MAERFVTWPIFLACVVTFIFGRASASEVRVEMLHEREFVPTEFPAADVRVVGTNCFILGAQPAALVLLDTTPLANIRKLGSYAAGTSAVNPNFVDVDVVGDRAYFANPVGLDVVDIADREMLKRLGRWTNASPGFAGVRVSNGLAYLTSGDRLRVLDVTDPTNIVEITNVVVKPGLRFFAVRIREHHLFVAGEQGLSVFDISNSTNITLLGTTNVGNGAADLEVVGPYAYLALLNQGLAIVDLSNPEDLREVGRSAVRYFGSDIDVRLPFALLAHRGGEPAIEVFDVSNPDAIAPIAHVRLVKNNFDTGVAFGPNGIYATGARGLEIISHFPRVWETLAIHGPANSPITIEGTVDLLTNSWSPVAALTTTEDPTEFLDLDCQSSQKFYRLRQP